MKHFVNALLQFLIVITSLLSIQTQAQQVLRPDELCSENPRAIASFADADLEAAVRSALSIGPVDDLACSLVTGLTALTTSGPGPTQIVSGSPRWPAADAPFESLAGLQNLTSLTRLALNNLDITDISQLSGLTNLTFLSLHTNYVSDISPLIGLTNLTSLLLSENPVSDISALRNLTELRMLRLHSQQIFPRLPQDAPHMGSISDITPLRGLINLRDLSLHTMLITDISALAGLINLTDLRINGNTISDISVLSRLTNLKYLALHNNLISDVSPLRELTNLMTLDLRFNPELSNIQPLIDNSGLSEGDTVEIRWTSVSCVDAALLEAEDVTVVSELEPPTAFGTCTP